MKRGITAFFIFILCIVFCVFSTAKYKATLKSALECFERIEELIKNNDLKNAIDESENALNKWTKERFIVEITTDRADVKEIEYAAFSVSRLLKNGETQAAADECRSAVCEIEYLLDKEKLTFENLF